MMDFTPRETSARRDQALPPAGSSTVAIRDYLAGEQTVALPLEEIRGWCREAHRQALAPERAVIEFKGLLNRVGYLNAIRDTDPLLRLRHRRLVEACIDIFYETAPL